MPAKFDALIVLGGGFRKNDASDPTDRPERFLSLESKNRILGAGEMFMRGEIGYIIITGGKTGKGKGENLSSEAEAMKNYLFEKYPEIPADKVILEDRAIDTATNITNIANVIADPKYKIDDCALMSSATHLARAQQILQANGIIAETFPAEEWEKLRSAHHEKFLARYSTSHRVTMQKALEIFYRTLTTLRIIDPRGKGLAQKATGFAREQK